MKYLTVEVTPEIFINETARVKREYDAYLINANNQNNAAIRFCEALNACDPEKPYNVRYKDEKHHFSFKSFGRGGDRRMDFTKVTKHGKELVAETKKATIHCGIVEIRVEKSVLQPQYLMRIALVNERRPGGEHSMKNAVKMHEKVSSYIRNHNEAINADRKAEEDFVKLFAEIQTVYSYAKVSRNKDRLSANVLFPNGLVMTVLGKSKETGKFFYDLDTDALDQDEMLTALINLPKK